MLRIVHLGAFIVFLIAALNVCLAQEMDEVSIHVTISNEDTNENIYESSSTKSSNQHLLNTNIPYVDDDDLTITGQEQQQQRIDLCEDIKCNEGEMCINSDNTNPHCECIEICEVPEDERQQICTTSNQTFVSDCHFLREKCWCSRDRDDIKCQYPETINDKLDYYGACQHIDDCSQVQKEIFPERMKVWLDEILHILDERKAIDNKYSDLVSLANKMKTNKQEKYWTAGVVLEFCNLDLNKDHNIQKDEVKSLVSSIKSLENCIQPFLDECDLDGNDQISDKEWAKCLDLTDEDLMLLKQHC